jgi:hypothetical protein
MRVAAAVIAKKWLRERFGIEVRGHLAQIGELVPRAFDADVVEDNPFFWPDAAMVPELESLHGRAAQVRRFGGRARDCGCDGVPPGWGEPIYGKLDGDLAAALMSINAVKGVEIGAGFAASRSAAANTATRSPRRIPEQPCRRHPRRHFQRPGRRRRSLSSRPPACVCRGDSVNVRGEPVEVITTGRHDPCVGIRATPIVEAMVALVLIDHALRHRAPSAAMWATSRRAFRAADRDRASRVARGPAPGSRASPALLEAFGAGLARLLRDCRPTFRITLPLRPRICHEPARPSPRNPGTVLRRNIAHAAEDPVSRLTQKPDLTIAIAGATGAVGETLLSILEERQFPFANLIPLASERSAGERVKCGARSFTVQELDSFDFKGVDIAFFSAGGKVSRVHAPRAARAGAVVIDNTSEFRYDDDVPLVVSEVNPDQIARTGRGASSPTRTARPCN